MDLTWLWASLIGVGATMLGTFLGWFLGKPKDRRLYIQVSKIVEPVETRNGREFFGGGLKDGELESLRLGLDLVFYNSSDKIKVVRNLRIEFHNDKRQLLFSCPLLDLGRAKNVNGFVFADDVEAFNVTPGYADLFKGEYFLSHTDLQKKDEVSMYFLAYEDEKMKKRLINLGSCNFKPIVLIKNNLEKNKSD
jgi:hypothetical protein